MSNQYKSIIIRYLKEKRMYVFMSRLHTLFFVVLLKVVPYFIKTSLLAF